MKFNSEADKTAFVNKYFGDDFENPDKMYKVTST